ncbi:hypothetical protein DV735_g5587, partial [Chaetothyriales sp. CBS 134920]
VITKAGFQKFAITNVHASLRDPDNFEMSTFNDHAAYGIIEVVQNLFLDYAEVRDGAHWGPQWAIVEATALFLNCGAADPMYMCEDGELVTETMELVARMFLDSLARLEREKLLGPDSPVQSLPLIIASSASAHALTTKQTTFHIRDWADFVRQYVHTYKLAAKLPKLPNYKETEKDVPEKAAAELEAFVLPEVTDAVTDPWNWTDAFAKYSKDKNVGGDEHDLTAWSSAKRKASSFDGRDPLTRSDIAALKAGKVMIKSTAPVLAEHGVALISHFYKRMLGNHPELRNIFNSAHQSTGLQPASLAHAVWAYSANIDNLGALTSAVTRIAHKHASLGIQPDQYPIVGENLLASIKEVLGDAATPALMDAWAVAYQQLADIFINFENDLYVRAKAAPGGWTGWRKFKVARKVPESEEITSFYLEPLEGKLPAFQAGQYISIRVFISELGLYQPRQYTLSDTGGQGDHFRISVKREAAKGENVPAGRISNILHKDITEGAELQVSNPFGEFTLDVESTTPVVLMSGGVGITPMLSMLETLVTQAPHREVVFVHAVRDAKVHAMKDYLSHVVKENPQVSRLIFYEQVGESDQQGKDYDYEGRIDLDKIKDKVLLPDAHYYLCGPLPFMKAHQKTLEGLGVPSERIHSEVFGSTTG